jgi:hypothetical protein
MFELTLIAAGLTLVSLLFQYALYFVVPAGLVRNLLTLVPVAVFLYVVMTPLGKEIIFGLAKDFKDDLVEGGKPAAYLDAFGLTVVYVFGNIGWWVIRARGRGESYAHGLMIGSLLSIIALA